MTEWGAKEVPTGFVREGFTTAESNPVQFDIATALLNADCEYAYGKIVVSMD